MIEGTITLKSTASGKLYGRILWEAQSNGTAANTSTVTAKIQLHRQSGFTTTGTWTGSLTVGGTTVNISYYGSIGSSWVTVKTLTAAVAHNADGSGTCYIYGKVSGPSGTSMAGVSVSGSETITLERIARYASIVSVSAFSDEGNPVLTYSNPAGEAVESLEAALSVDGESTVAAYRSLSKTGTSYTFSLTDAERNALRAASSKSNALTVYVLLRSVISGVSNVAKTSVTMTIVNAHPTVTPTIVDTNSKTIALTGGSKILVALHSVAKVTVNAAAKKGASISSVKVEHGTAVLTGDGTLNVTNSPIKITATDSRGNTVAYTATNAIIPYIDPTAVIENSMPNAAGEMDLAATGKIFDGSFGKTENAFSVKYRFKEGYGSYGDWITFDSAAIDGFDYVAEAAITGLDYQKAYTFQVAVYDSLHPEGVLSTERKFVAKPIADWSGTDWNFNVPVSMSGNKITDIPTPENAGDAIPYGYKDPQYLSVSGGTMKGAISMNSQRITGLPEPSAPSDAATKKTVTDAVSAIAHVESKKLWENESPTSSFEAQTIVLDLRDYDYILVFARFATDNSDESNEILRIGSTGRFMTASSIGSANYMTMYTRVFSAAAEGVVFEDGYKHRFDQNSTTKTNTNMIPMVIYGVKGIS